MLGLKITVIGTSANTVAQTVPVGGFVGDVALSPDGSRLYASNLELLANGAAQQVISVINTASFAVDRKILISDYSTQSYLYPVDILASSDNARLYVAVNNPAQSSSD